MTTTMPPPPGGSGPPGRANWTGLFAAFVAGALVASLAWVQVVDSRFDPQPVAGGANGFLPEATEEADSSVAADDAGPGGQRRVTEQALTDDGAAAEGGGGGVQLGGGSGVDGPGGPGDGGGTDGKGVPGVTASTVKLGATVVRDGIAKAFLGEVELGIEAVRQRVNASPDGIHGRKLEIVYKNDNWDPGTGRRFLENLIVQEQVFALAVSPSSEGLNAASNAGLFDRHGVPVVGADGLNNTQFLDPWIWPVAAATTTQAHVIMRDAWERCGRDSGCEKLEPAIVFGNTYRFGVEGAFAFNGAYCRLTAGNDEAFTADGKCNGGENIPGFSPGGTACDGGVNGRFCGISANQSQFPGEIDKVKKACAPHEGRGACNFVLLLLEPATALSWMGGDFPAAKDFERDGECCGMAGAQPLFTSNFAVQCGTKCNRMRVWTGYNPPIGKYLSEKAVQQYSQELRARSSRADVNNQFTMGGYIGMTLLVEALREVGPEPTREKLVATLNSMAPLKTGLTNPEGLKWTGDQRYANHSAQAFRIDFSNTFNGFREATGYTREPDGWLGRDNRLP